MGRSMSRKKCVKIIEWMNQDRVADIKICVYMCVCVYFSYCLERWIRMCDLVFLRLFLCAALRVEMEASQECVVNFETEFFLKKEFCQSIYLFFVVFFFA